MLACLLDFHKYRQNFKDTIDPMCPAKDGVEDKQHYLLLCQSYEEHRRELLSDRKTILLPCEFSKLANELSVELILYGNERL